MLSLDGLGTAVPLLDEGSAFMLVLGLVCSGPRNYLWLRAIDGADRGCRGGIRPPFRTLQHESLLARHRQRHLGAALV